MSVYTFKTTYISEPNDTAEYFENYMGSFLLILGNIIINKHPHQIEEKVAVKDLLSNDAAFRESFNFSVYLSAWLLRNGGMTVEQKKDLSGDIMAILSQELSSEFVSKVLLHTSDLRVKWIVENVLEKSFTSQESEPDKEPDKDDAELAFYKKSIKFTIAMFASRLESMPNTVTIDDMLANALFLKSVKDSLRDVLYKHSFIRSGEKIDKYSSDKASKFLLNEKAFSIGCFDIGHLTKEDLLVWINKDTGEKQ